MEKEIISYDNFNLPVRINNLRMEDGGIYRGIHSHKAVEIVRVKSGTLRCQINETLVEVIPNQIVFINSNVSHKLFSENAEISYFQVDTSLLEENETYGEFSNLYAFIAHTKANPYLLFSDNKEITELLDKIDNKYFQNTKENRLYIKAYLYELVAFMYSYSFISHLSISKEQINKIEPMVNYIEANYKSPIMLQDICVATRYNKYTICHTFKSVTGSTVFDYINFLRINYAVDRLKNTESSILEIATDCGFSSATYFNRVFKSFFGCAPSVYRKHMLKNIIY